ncbi:MAG: HupE/UreJ family protein [Porticoccus sp.]
MTAASKFRLKLAWCLVLFLLTLSFESSADEFRPALLEVTEQEGGWVEVTWKVPTLGEQVLAITPIMPEFFKPFGPGSNRRVPGAMIETKSYSTDGQALHGAMLSVNGLSAVPTDVVVRISLLDGIEHSAILRSNNSSFTIPEQITNGELAVSYWRMGTIHILEGFDHLLFLLTLLLIVTGIWPLLKTVTAFTLAHSLTLALATLDLVHIPQVPTEGVISLSIMLLAVEVVRKNQGQMTLSERYPWLIAFTFGLVHGLGFAGALYEIGVPQNAVPLALLMFNVGVETGQILFVLTVSVLLVGLHRLHGITALTLEKATPYAIGGIAAFWTIDRVSSFL